MLNRFSRRIPALLLIASIFSASLVAVAVPAQNQQMPPPPVMPPAQQSGNTNQSGAQQQQTSPSQQPAQQRPRSANSNSNRSSSPAQQRPLRDNENPAMIGRRRINSGLTASMSMSLEREVAWGRQLAAEIDRQARFIDDPVITEYVNRVGQNIVLHSDARIPFTIKVVDSDEVNAFALPGGFFYVNKGLILAADNEAELAGVMAHEIAHVAARHMAEQVARMQLLQYGMIAGILLGVPPILVDAASIAAGIGLLKYSRGAEEEADRLGVQYLYAAGYDPSAMATMFEKLAARNRSNPGFFARLFSTHPQPANRLVASQTLVARFPVREEYVISSSEFQRVRARLLRLSNARASTAGNIGGSDSGAPARPTLRRRGPASDDPAAQTPGTEGQTQPGQQPAPPVLRRRDPAPQPSPTPSPGSNP